MFSNREEEGTKGFGLDQTPQAEDTIIGNTIKIEGDLVSNGNIIVEGEVVGTLKTDRSLRIGAAAKVKADIKAAEALIAGEVSGNIDIDGKLELTASAKVSGDVKAKILSIESGASFNGSCSMDNTVTMVAGGAAHKQAVDRPKNDDKKTETEA
ncbi:TPA: hypothetical protein DF272_01130 [Candidatus Falkowbacteria bacterium]|nr:hypothetical protein [Candidatus Falkowbacteria bacterium]